MLGKRPGIKSDRARPTAPTLAAKRNIGRGQVLERVQEVENPWVGAFVVRGGLKADSSRQNIAVADRKTGQVNHTLHQPGRGALDQRCTDRRAAVIKPQVKGQLVEAVKGISQHQRPNPFRVAQGIPDGEVPAEGVSDQHQRHSQLKGINPGAEMVKNIFERVATQVFRCVALAVAGQIEGVSGISGFGQFGKQILPVEERGRQPMNQDDRCAAALLEAVKRFFVSAGVIHVL